MRPHSRVHEQIGDIFKPAGNFVKKIFRLARPKEPTRYLDFGVLGRQNSLRILNNKSHFGHSQRLHIAGAVKNYLLHFGPS